MRSIPTSRKALITGGAGFIGSHLAESLLADGWEVYVLDDLSTGSLSNISHLLDRRDFHLVVDSVLSEAVVNELVHKCDVVYHLAAVVGVRLIVEQPVHTIVTNIRGTEVVLDKCNRFNKRVLIASTSEVYGDHRKERALHENDRRVYGPTTQRRWAYADSKAMDEFLALAYGAEQNLDFVIARLFNTVGPRQTGQYGMVVPSFIQRALDGEVIDIHGNGEQTRCFCHVADVVRALRGLMETPQTRGEIYNVGSKNKTTILGLAERICAAVGIDTEFNFVPYDRVYGEGIEDMLHREPAIDKIRHAIGWAPERDLDQIVADVIAERRALAFQAA
ncbi:GDP-mannose 4,6-dehydratase [Solirubrobacter sp. CPCC 204708]|uniref:GDP-mannose 4,6-dehydratase n=1 Tax=Solirubrobacter deserti TaxID=2282478 RepID=A0ABT4RIJ6_9ACTN|nr:NAD-dependent epimerase/dehydratase family protein [Solirubrobacter deserti]MBE2320227.1 GDP-mannose 4,6-dehydratase [Solirubrobacter deserti]MDA0138387.1 GDP-mannose 4,6-dehydratase [Solirubrobacter deserti]